MEQTPDGNYFRDPFENESLVVSRVHLGTEGTHVHARNVPTSLWKQVLTMSLVCLRYEHCTFIFPMDEVKVNEYIFKYISGKGKMTDLSIPEIDFQSLKSCSN